MADPQEGVAPDGTIKTGARRDRVPAAFEPILRDAVERMPTTAASLYVYGSVADGTARPHTSDVDLLAVDLPHARGLGESLSREYADICRGVEVAALTADDLVGDTDAAYGNRVFLRHYCIHLAGPDLSNGLSAFPADARAARGFNGDLGRHLSDASKNWKPNWSRSSRHRHPRKRRNQPADRQREGRGDEAWVAFENLPVMVGIARLAESGRWRLCSAALRSSSRRLVGWLLMAVSLLGGASFCLEPLAGPLVIDPKPFKPMAGTTVP